MQLVPLRFESNPKQYTNSESPSRCCAQPLSAAFSAIIATIMRSSRPPRLQFARVPPVSHSTVSQICVQQWSELEFELDRWQLIDRAASATAACGVGECQP
ncbi:hypothetical protein AWZ03_004927 [Drosophila navojoa]|uniref:Uncharacterized protein n=1 Tax=Drosophila navojoa TaxID=7232 RepID=A0A484BIN7_DRONA|nr:hypothetical protein AWZ03_004927 [Drosophila navojoa]